MVVPFSWRSQHRQTVPNRVGSPRFADGHGIRPLWHVEGLPQVPRYLNRIIEIGCCRNFTADHRMGTVGQPNAVELDNNFNNLALRGQ